MVAVKHSNAFLTSHHLYIVIHTVLLLSSAAVKLPFEQNQKDLASFSKCQKSRVFQNLQAFLTLEFV